MKRTASIFPTIVIPCLLMALSSGAYAYIQTELPYHIPRDGDRLHPNMSFAPDAIAKVDSVSRSVSLNPELFAPMDEADVSVYVDGDTLSYVQFATRHIFVISRDTLSFAGHENRASAFRVDNSPGVVLPGSCPSTVASGWTGRQTLHGRDFLKRAKGISRNASEPGWTLAADSDTLHGVTYAVWDMEMEYFDSESIASGVPDSIASGSISDLLLPVREMSAERILTRREMWFSETSRYPVLQRSRSFRLRDGGDGNRDTIPVATLAMYYPPAFQHSDTGEEPGRHEPGQKPYGQYGEDTPGYGVEGSGRVMVSEAVAAGGSVSVTVSACGKDEEDVTLTLHTDSGIRLTEPIRVKAGAVPQTHSIPIPANISGVLIVLIETDGGRVPRKVIL